MWRWPEHRRFRALIGLSNVLRGLSRARATGLVAVAGGLGEMFAVCGIGAILIGQAIATFLLPYCSDILARRLKAKLVSRPVDLHEGLMLLFVGPFLWLTWFQSDHTF